MKKIFCFLLALILTFSACGCSALKDFNVSDVKEYLDNTKLDSFGETSSLAEIDYDEPFVYNTYYDSGYTSLTEKQRGLYEDLYLIALQMPNGYVRLSDYYDDYYTDVGIAYNAMINDHPDFFWMPYTYIVADMTDSAGKYICIAFEIDDGESKNEYLVKKSNRDQMRQQLDAKIDEIIKLSKEYTGEYQKEKFLNDYICENTVYDEKADLSQTTYGCLINGRALCEGYARAFKLLCNEAGIRCDLIYGFSENENHMWNCVNVAGKYSHVDVTWNDSTPESRYVFFNITDEQALNDRKIFRHFSEVSNSEIDNGEIVNFVNWKCDYKGNTYFAKNKLILKGDNAEQIAEKIENCAEKNEKSLAVMIEDKKLLKSIKGNNIDIIEEIASHLENIDIEKYSLVRDVLILYFSDY